MKISTPFFPFTASPPPNPTPQHKMPHPILSPLSPHLPGKLLDAVCEPVRVYLRRRADTIRTIVSLLTEGDGTSGEGGLLRELAGEEDGSHAGDGSTAAVMAAAARSGASWVTSEAEGDDAALRLLEALEAADKAAAAATAGAPSTVPVSVSASPLVPLEPPPPLPGLPPPRQAPLPALHAGAGGSAGASPAADIVASLVRVYGGAAPFIAEFRGMLSARLLATDGYDVQRELFTLELLKLRCVQGQVQVHTAAVLCRVSLPQCMHTRTRLLLLLPCFTLYVPALP